MLKTVINYLKGVNDELKRVEWPSRDQVLKHTYVVVVLSLVIGGFLAIIDYALIEGLRYLIG